MTAQDDNQARNQDCNHDRDFNDLPHWQGLVSGYVLGDLSSEEMVQVQQHLASNPEARKEVVELQATLNLLPLSLPEDAVPAAGLHSRLLASAIATPQEAKTRTVSPTVVDSQSRQPGLSRWSTPVAWGAMAAAVTAAWLGFQNLQLRSDLQFAQQQFERLAAIESQLATAKADVAEYQEIIAMLRLPENRLLALTGASGFTETSSGSVIISPQENWAMLTLKDLPKPPAGKAYQLWAMANGEKVYCVEFKPDATGQVLVEVPVGNWAGTPMVSITLEDEGTIPTETSEMIMNGAVI